MEQQSKPLHSGNEITPKRHLLKTSYDDECIFSLIRMFIFLVRLDTDRYRLLALFETISEHAVSHFRAEGKRLRQFNHCGDAVQCADHLSILDGLVAFRQRMVSGQRILNSEYLHVFDPLIIHCVREKQPVTRIRTAAQVQNSSIGIKSVRAKVVVETANPLAFH